jgi:hypothetical protein
MKCPNCSSGDTQKLSVIYFSGTHNINMKSNAAGVGTGWGTGGSSFFTGAASISTTGIQQSMLAKASSPPQERSMVPLAFLAAAAFGLGYFEQYFYAFISAVLAGCWYYFAHRYNTTEYPEQYRLWNSKWHCNRCGEFYYVDKI